MSPVRQKLLPTMKLELPLLTPMLSMPLHSACSRWLLVALLQPLLPRWDRVAAAVSSRLFVVRRSFGRNAPHLVKAISDRRAFQLLGAEEFQPLPRRAFIATIGTATVEPPPLKPPPLEPRTRRGLKLAVCIPLDHWYLSACRHQGPKGLFASWNLCHWNL